jgi:hypothetical protein
LSVPAIATRWTKVKAILLTYTYLWASYEGLDLDAIINEVLHNKSSCTIVGVSGCYSL